MKCLKSIVLGASLILLASAPVAQANSGTDSSNVAAPEARARPARAIGDVCRSYVRSGWLYKPASDHSGAPREGKPNVIFPRNKPNKSRLRVYSSNGVQICDFKKWSEEKKYGQRYYSGTGSCNRKGSALATASRQKGGNGTIFIEARGTSCVGPITPTRRQDKR